MHGLVLSWGNLLTTGAVIGMIAGALNFTYRLRRWFESTNELLKEQSKHLTRQDARMDAIEHELQPNSGSSHHDKVLDALTEVNKRLDREQWRRRSRFWL